MLSSQSKKPSPGFRPATPDLAHAKDSTSLLERTRKEVLVTPITDLDCSVFNAVATAHLGSVGTFTPKSHEGIVALASTIAESNDTSALAGMNQPHHIASNSPEVEKKASPALTLSIQPPLLNIFSQNVTPPALSTSLPPPGSCFEDTAQLAYCGNLLRKYLSPSSTAASISKESLDPTQRALIESYAQKEDEMDWVRQLIQRVVEAFAAGILNSSDDLFEVLLLVPCLDQEHYSKLLNCVIAEFETSKLLDMDLLQGLVQLVESASSDYLERSDLVRILIVLRTRLQDTPQQSTRHRYHLTWAFSSLLDVMVEGKVKDLRRVDQEPLFALFGLLQDSADPYLQHQTIYALQGLMHVPNDETRRQFVLRHAGNITMGLLGVESVCKLDLEQVKGGTDRLYMAAGEAHEISTKVADGAQSLLEDSQGIWASIKQDSISGGRQLWYSALREAQEHVRNGRLQDFNHLVFEAPCRTHIEFRWGVTQLLGEIGMDFLWGTTTRQHAVDFLVELYRSSLIWDSSNDIDQWILSILFQIVTLDDIVISDHVQSLLCGLEKASDASKQGSNCKTLTGPRSPYPIRARLSIPTSSTLLSRVLSIPPVEYGLLKLRDRRLKKKENALYIPPQAKPSLQSSDDTLFPLMEKAREFLDGPGLVFLLLGDSGGGKSTFNLQLERTLWKTYSRGGPVPLHINLPSVDNPHQDLIAKQLRQLGFSEAHIMKLKHNRKFIVICDGYDECQLTTNLHTTNLFNHAGQWKVNMVVTCRTQYLGSNYSNRFAPQGSGPYDPSDPSLFQKAVIAPFTKEQIQRYIDMYVSVEPRIWNTQDYIDRLATIPNLLDLVRNPFLLTLALEALPGVTEGKKDLSKIKISRVQLYDTFVHHWLRVNQRRLERNNALSSNDRDMLVQLVDADFVSLGIDYSSKLAQAIFDKQEGNPLVQYVQLCDKNTWKAEFFGSKPEVRLLRESSPLTRAGNQFRFIHRSMLEYFLSRVIYSPARIDSQECDPQIDTVSSAVTLVDTNGPLFRHNLVRELSIVQFLCDRVKSNSDFEQELRRIVNLSKTDSNVAIAATNAITILVRAGARFNGADLRGVQIPGADLTDGQFDSAQLQGANLTGVILSRSWLRQADLSGARLEDVRFGELTYLHTLGPIDVCIYSPDGRMLAVGYGDSCFSIYDTSTWTVIHRVTTGERVKDIAFSPNSQQIVSAGQNGALQTWDCTSGEKVLVMNGHTEDVRSVAFSPCGKQIASASNDGTVRLWDSQTGESQFVLRGHTSWIKSVKYSPDGCQLVSGSQDKTIRFWNPQTGEESAVLSSSLGTVECLAYSPDGRWIASSHVKGDLQLWDASTRESGPVLRGHTKYVTGIEFSPSSQWIASSSYDKTVRLWDTYGGTILSVWTGHSGGVKCVAFSPSGLQVASGGSDQKVRRWEIDSAWSSLDPRDGSRVDRIAYALDGSNIFAQSSCRVFRKWDAETGASESESIPLEFAEPQAVSCMAFTPDGSQFAVGFRNGSIHLWNRETDTAGPVLEAHSSMARILVYSPCCRWIASIGENNTMRLWDLHNTEQPRVVFEGENGMRRRIRVVVFSPIGDQLAVGTVRGTVRLFDLQSIEHLVSNAAIESDLVSMVYSPNGRQIAIGAKNGYIYLWDHQSKEPVAKLSGHEARIRCIAYSPCGQWIASGSDNNTVGIWHRQLIGEAESWSEVHSACSFFGGVNNVAWNPVMHLEFVTGCEDGSIRVWRLSSDERGNVAVKMVWGSNIGILCADGLGLNNATGLSHFNQKLLVQRGALSGGVS